MTITQTQKSMPRVTPGAEATLPTPRGSFRLRAWIDEGANLDHATLSTHPDDELPEVPLVRLHSECVTGDIFGSYKCDCGEQLDLSLRLIQEQGGVLVYLRGHEGRGIGLANKVAAYALQEQGVDTLDANLELGLPADARDYASAAAILRHMGITRLRLLTNNPLKSEYLDGCGLEVVETVPVEVAARPENRAYLETKKTRMRHRLDLAGPDTIKESGDA